MNQPRARTDGLAHRAERAHEQRLVAALGPGFEGASPSLRFLALRRGARTLVLLPSRRSLSTRPSCSAARSILEATPLLDVAVHLPAIASNPAATERLFSAAGNILT